MAYDEKLADRIRGMLAGRRGLNEREMFGGIGFTIDGKMVAGVHGKELITRVPSEEHDKAVKETGARTFDITGRPMTGWLLVGPAGTSNGPPLKKWVERSVSYVATLPAKKPMKKKTSKKSVKPSAGRRGRR
jgi:TfoX/Sxy family transcriptional regulator of competence genes